MTCDETGEKLVDSWRGEATPADAAALAEHLAGCAACRADADALARLWREMGEPPAETPSPRLRERFDAMLAAAIREERGAPLLRPEFGLPRKTRRAGSAVTRFAALAAMLALGVLVGAQLSSRRDERQMAALAGEVASLHETVTLALLAESSPSERLQGVAYGRELSGADERVAAALLGALLEDSNVNVRLAALEALRPLAARPDGRPRLVAAFAGQDSPLVAALARRAAARVRLRRRAPRPRAAARQPESRSGGARLSARPPRKERLMNARARLLALVAFSAARGLSPPPPARSSRRRSCAAASSSDPRCGRSSIDNVFGSVQVKAGAAGRVELVIHQTIVADDAEALAAAKREVLLDVVEGSARLELVQDGPFRDDCDRRCDDDATDEDGDESRRGHRGHRRCTATGTPTTTSSGAGRSPFRPRSRSRPRTSTAATSSSPASPARSRSRTSTATCG